MNNAAEKHLAKAGEYLAKGEDFYRKAAEEIVAAQKADSTLSNREIGAKFGHSEAWVRGIVTWSTSSSRGAPFADLENPSKRKITLDSVIGDTDKMTAEERAKLANVLVAQPEVVERIVDSGPMALDPYLDLAENAYRTSRERNERKTKETFPTHAAMDARKEIATATRHLRNAQYEIVQWRVGRHHDRFMLLEGALNEAKAIIEAIDEILDEARESA